MVPKLLTAQTSFGPLAQTASNAPSTGSIDVDHWLPSKWAALLFEPTAHTSVSLIAKRAPMLAWVGTTVTFPTPPFHEATVFPLAANAVPVGDIVTAARLGRG